MATLAHRSSRIAHGRGWRSKTCNALADLLLPLQICFNERSNKGVVGQNNTCEGICRFAPRNLFPSHPESHVETRRVEG